MLDPNDKDSLETVKAYIKDIDRLTTFVRQTQATLQEEGNITASELILSVIEIVFQEEMSDEGDFFDPELEEALQVLIYEIADNNWSIQDILDAQFCLQHNIPDPPSGNKYRLFRPDHQAWFYESTCDILIVVGPLLDAAVLDPLYQRTAKKIIQIT